MVGQVISLTPCVRNVARIMTRALYTVVNQKQSWNSKVELTKEACDELTFSIDNVDSLNFRCPWLPFQPPARFVYSNASDYACSSFIVCASSGISLEMKWIPTDSNLRANSLSRIIVYYYLSN